MAFRLRMVALESSILGRTRLNEGAGAGGGIVPLRRGRMLVRRRTQGGEDGVHAVLGDSWPRGPE